jgi:hypothetical protein
MIAILSAMAKYVVRPRDVEQTVGVTLIEFPEGGSWSRFVAP